MTYLISELWLSCMNNAFHLLCASQLYHHRLGRQAPRPHEYLTSYTAVGGSRARNFSRKRQIGPQSLGVGPRASEIIPYFVHDFRIQVRQQVEFNPSVPDAPTWRISAFEKILYESESSQSIADSVKRPGRGFSITNRSLKNCQITHIVTMQKSLCHDFHKFSDFSSLRADRWRLSGQRILKFVLKRLAVICL